MAATEVAPGDGLRVQVNLHGLRDVIQVREAGVNAVALLLHEHPVAEQALGLFERVRALGQVGGDAEPLAQIILRVDHRPARVFLLDAAEQVRREVDLGLDFLFAVAVVVVRDQRHHDALLVAGRDLEGVAVVVALVGGAPALVVAPLPLRGVVPVRQAGGLLGQRGQVRGEDDVARVAGPVFDVRPGVVLRQERVARVAEDALHEVQIAGQVAGGEELDLHRLFRRDALDFGDDDGAHHQGDEGFHGRERQQEQGAGRMECGLQQMGEGDLRHGHLVVGDGRAALGDMEDALGGAPVALGVVQDALPVHQPVRLDDVGLEQVAVFGQRQFLRHARPVKNEALAQPRQRDGLFQWDISEVAVHKCLHAPVNRAGAPVGLAHALLEVGDDFIGDAEASQTHPGHPATRRRR